MRSARVIDAQGKAFRGLLAAAMGVGDAATLPPARVTWWRVVCWLLLDLGALLVEVALFLLFVVLVVLVSLALVVGGAYAARFGWNLAG